MPNDNVSTLLASTDMDEHRQAIERQYRDTNVIF